MSYASLRECVDDLARHRQLIRIDAPVDAHLEAAAIHRRVHAAGGPAVYFANVTGCKFPMVSNLFGTMERTRLMFRDALDGVERLVRRPLHASQVCRRRADPRLANDD
jgi:4-hydroxy-3-polyprenylbenzoate decarboxylase